MRNPSPQATQAAPVGQLRLALVLLWTAWGISVIGYLNHVSDRASGSWDVYSVVGLPGILLQAVVLGFLARRNNLARIVILLTAVPAFIIALIFFRAQIAPVRLIAETLMRATALGILFMPSVAPCFRNRAAAT